MEGLAWVFFVLFAFILAGMYLGIRRQWAAPSVVAGAGVALSIITMILMSLAQKNLPLQAIIVGILLGGLFSGTTLTVAWYFQRNELRTRYVSETGYPGETPAVDTES